MTDFVNIFLLNRKDIFFLHNQQKAANEILINNVIKKSSEWHNFKQSDVRLVLVNIFYDD